MTRDGPRRLWSLESAAVAAVARAGARVFDVPVRLVRRAVLARHFCGSRSCAVCARARTATVTCTVFE